MKPRVRVRLTNRWAVFLCSPELKVQLKKLFRYHPPNYEFYPAYREDRWDGYVNMLLRGRVATGLFLTRRARVEERYRVTTIDERVFPKFKRRPE